MTQILKKLCCHSQPYFPPLLTNTKMHQHIGSWHLSLTALFYIGKVIYPLSKGSLIIFIYSGPALLHVMKEQSCLARRIFQSSWELKSAGDRNTQERGGSDFCCSYVSWHDARAGGMNTLHYFGSLNMQRGGLLGFWSWSKVVLICYTDTQRLKCPQRAGLYFSSVQSACWGSKKSKPMHNISAPLMESPMRSAFLIGRRRGVG